MDDPGHSASNQEPIYQNIDHMMDGSDHTVQVHRPDTPAGGSEQHHSRSGSSSSSTTTRSSNVGSHSSHSLNSADRKSEGSHKEGNSLNSFGLEHVYANPTFSEHPPEIPHPDYDAPEANENHIHNDSISNISNNSTRRASSPHSENMYPPLDDFYNVELHGTANSEAPPSEAPTMVVVPEQSNTWLSAMYGVIAFIGIFITVLIIWLCLVYGV